MKRNRLEVSGFKFSKSSAILEADRIIRERQSKVNAAKKPYHDAIKEHDDCVRRLSVLIAESASLAMEEPTEEINKKREGILANITAYEEQLASLFAAIEPARLAKVKAMRSCVPAWKLQPVECIGKRGGNYVFLSKI